jgi:polygalacturonase
MRCILICSLATLAISTLVSAQTPVRVYDVRTYGATGDGRTIDTMAINRAIDAAAAAGGGTVHFPAGEYLSYSIRLKSNIAFYLDAGSVIVAAEPSADLVTGYDPPEPNPDFDQYMDFGHAHWHNSLIWGENLDNISITGPGRIFGRGLSRGTNRRDMLPAERALPTAQQPDLSLPVVAREMIAKIRPGPFNYPGNDTLPAGVGNKAIALKNCRNVIFRDFTIYHGGHFAILATGVDNWTCDNLKIDTNRDGIDIDCCQNVRVTNCTINSPYDDGLCLKSSYALGYVRSTGNVTISNCQISGYDEGTLLDGTRQRNGRDYSRGGPHGRIKFGTESNGGFRNITITNCLFDYCRGLALESVDGALMEDITVTNLSMRDIGNAPIFIRLGARLRGPEGTKVGAARRIKIANVVAHNVSAESGIHISGLPDALIEDLSISNLFIDYAGGGTQEQGERVVPELANGYPEPSHFGIIPAWGMWVRHVKKISVDHVEFRAAQPDLRSSIILDHVADVSLSHLKHSPVPGVATLWLQNVTGLTIDNCPGLPEVHRNGLIADQKY